MEGVFSQFSDILLDATIVRKYLNTETFYWRLPEQFQGDQVRQLINWNALLIILCCINVTPLLYNSHFLNELIYGKHK